MPSDLITEQPPVKKVAVVGATGMLGAPVAATLAESGLHVTALVRDTRRALSRLPAAVQLVTGDVRDRSSLCRLMENQDALYVNLSVKPGEKKTDFHTETDGMQNIISTAREAGIRRLAFLSSLAMRYQGMNGFHWWVFEVKRQAVDLVKTSGIPYTIFYPSTFMENFQGNFRRGNFIFLAGKSEHEMYFVAANDFARQVTQSLRLATAANTEYVVQGPEGMTMDQAAEVYSRHYPEGKLKIVRAPFGLLKSVGFFNNTIDYGVKIVEALNRYPEKFESGKTWKELGVPVITLAAYASKKE